MAHIDMNLSAEELMAARKKNQAKIWKVAGILTVVTAIEFIFAFMMEAGAVRNIIFMVLTIVKAFFIVAEFMHLKAEVKGLIYSILLPIVFIVWLIIAMYLEWGVIFLKRFTEYVGG
jgi:cytochrome c oxidase subunit IV